MKILLDECVPRRLGRDLMGHSVHTVPSMGWAGIKNGALLHLADDSFDVFITIDRNLQYQQSLRGLTLAIIVLNAANSRLDTLRPLIGDALTALDRIKPGEVILITAAS